MSEDYTGPERRAGEPDRRSGTDRRNLPAPQAGGHAERRGAGSATETPPGESGPAASGQASSERRAGERRSVIDRRNGLDRRRGPGRRRSDTRRQAEEGEMADELLEFVLAIDDYKRTNRRPFPSWSEVYEVIRYLGYRKVAPRGEHIDRPSADPPASG